MTRRIATFSHARLVALMAAAELKNADVADEVGVSAEAVRRWRLPPDDPKGGSEPRGWQTIKDLAACLGCAVDDLYDFEEDTR